MFTHKKKLSVFPYILLLFFSADSAEKLYVFFPAITRTHLIQERLQNSLKGVEVMVFGRYSDFLIQVETNPPTGIIAKTPLVDQFTDYSENLIGNRKNKTEETYVLLSTEKKVDLQSIEQQTIVGVVDFLGRKSMNNFTESLLGNSHQIKCVTKPEDLIPLLIFDMVDCILLEKSTADYFRMIYDLDFKETSVYSEKHGIISFAVRQGSNAEKTVEGLKKLGAANMYIFGIDKWM